VRITYNTHIIYVNTCVSIQNVAKNADGPSILTILEPPPTTGVAAVN